MEVFDLPQDPQNLAQSGYDGIWVELKDRPSPSPLEGKTLQWLDWKLQGQLSRWILEAKREADAPVFVPTMRKLPAQYVVLVRKADPKKLKESCDGLGLKKVLLICEDPDRSATLGKEFQAKGGKWPQLADLGREPGEGRV